MNKNYLLIFIVILFAACSPIDSTRVFDDAQAARLVHHWAGAGDCNTKS